MTSENLLGEEGEEEGEILGHHNQSEEEEGEARQVAGVELKTLTLMPLAMVVVVEEMMVEADSPLDSLSSLNMLDYWVLGEVAGEMVFLKKMLLFQILLFLELILFHYSCDFDHYSVVEVHVALQSVPVTVGMPLWMLQHLVPAGTCYSHHQVALGQTFSLVRSPRGS